VLRAITGLERISAAGGAGETLTKPDAGKDERTHRWPQILPGEKAVLFTIGDLHHPDYFLDARIAVERLETGERKTLPIKGTYARYTSSGHLLLMQEAGLVAVPFDLKRLEVTGTPAPAANDVAFNFLTGAVDFDVSNTGELVYIPKGILYGDLSLAWLDRHGKVEKLPMPKFVILWKPADGSGMEEVLVSPQSSLQVPLSFTPDGKFLAYMFSNPNARLQVNLAPLHGERTPKPFVASQFDDNGGLFSPDGRWLAYFSNESGQFEVYVQPFPGPGGRWQISASGGYGPVWARSGRELFYTDGNQIFSAGVTTQPHLVSSTPRPVVPFTPGVIGLFSYNRIFDVAPDGQRFLVVEKSGENTAPEELRLVEGWLDELARRPPRTQMNEP
jgi:WD40-like Beta Propeller Repeat